MMTEIHALPPKTTDVEDNGPLSKKHAMDKKVQDKKKEKLIKEKKRILKRLWREYARVVVNQIVFLCNFYFI